ncbi:glycosyltransferase family 2 protein [Duganella sp. FT3S]|uniref:Glycosyltransferase family 2 protein n=1 Tax=Rugamonas fusca TaxID=2758568 RepID=A0A7W2ELB5_9BURK|nr:glycosyltransferase family A protein [Rugamonas fusca]MBA5607988.1 glycosyltransferase family 2 protein [Rugamonas fusca]
MSPPSISLIMAAYNAAPFIADTLERIVGQMTARHELIVVDDGSRDDTADQVRAFQARHPALRIVLHQQANAGIAGARNAGLALAGGQYLAFIDSDDRLRPGALAALGDVIARERPDVISTAFHFWHPDAPHKDRDVQLSYPAGRRIEGQEAILAPFFDDRHTYLWNNICRREVYARLPQPPFPAGRVFEDLSVVPLLLAHCHSMVYLPFVLLDYRQHPASITKAVSARWCVDVVTALASARAPLAQAGISATVQERFDAAVCDFYVGTVKCSYQLPGAEGAAVRTRLREIFLTSLFAPVERLRARLGAPGASKADRRNARQLGQILRGDWLFQLRQTASRQFKLWRRARAAQ